MLSEESIAIGALKVEVDKLRRDNAALRAALRDLLYRPIGATNEERRERNQREIAARAAIRQAGEGEK